MFFVWLTSLSNFLVDLKKTRLGQQDFICVCGRFKGEGSSFVCEGSGPIMAMQLERHRKPRKLSWMGWKPFPTLEKFRLSNMVSCAAALPKWIAYPRKCRVVSFLFSIMRCGVTMQIRWSKTLWPALEMKIRRLGPGGWEAGVAAVGRLLGLRQWRP